MRLHRVPAVRGAAWVRQGFAVFARRPLAFAALFTAFLFFALVTALLPFVGPLLCWPRCRWSRSASCARRSTR